VIRIGTRRSTLALAQANAIAEALSGRGVLVEIVPMRTEGDRLSEAPLSSVGGKGLFVRDIEQALLAGGIDVAVHSLKDLPAELPPNVCLAAFPPREDPRDVLITRRGGCLRELPPGAVVGTSSPRRRALLLAARPDVAVQSLRGNVDTRLRKLQSGLYDAIVLAAAGLRRLGLEPAHAEVLPLEEFIPAVGQGIVAVEARRADEGTLAALAPLDDAVTRACAEAERGFLGHLGASCNSPLAAHAIVVEGNAILRLSAVIASEDGRAVMRAHAEGSVERAGAVGRELAQTMLERGASQFAPLHPVARGVS
jgi:hydroxymethylbilane synthase